MQSKNSTIPTSIRVLAIVLVVIGCVVGVAGYLNPGAVWTGLDRAAPGVATLAAQASARNLAMAGVLAAALVLKHREVLAFVFLMRAAIETQDMVITLATGAMPLPGAVVVLLFVGLFIAPELISARWLLRHAAESEGTR